MGSSNTKVESRDKCMNGNIKKIQGGTKIQENSRERDKRISDLFKAAEKNATTILEQLKDDDVLSFSVVKNGGVAFNATLDGHMDSVYRNGHVGNRMPPKLVERLQSRLKEEYDRDERNIMADIIKAEEAKEHALKMREMNERQENAKKRREEKENNMKEKVNKKIQYIEEVQQRRDSVKTAKSRMSTPSLHVLEQ